MTISGEFLNIYQLARAAAELRVEWPLPAEVLAPFNVPTDPVDFKVVRPELSKVLRSPAPSRFFKVLRALDHQDGHLGEVSSLIGVYTGDVHHNNRDAWDHTMGAIDRSRMPDLNCSPAEVAAVLGIYFRKAVQARWGEGIGWDTTIADFCGFYGLPFEDAMESVSRNYMHMHNFNNLAPESMLNLWYVAGNSLRIGVDGFARVCQADAQGSYADLTLNPYPQRQAFLDVVGAIRATDVSQFSRDKEKARAARLESVKTFLSAKSNPSA